MKAVFYSIAIIFALLLIFQYGNAYATHLTAKTTWQMVYVTHNPTCSNYDYQILNKYTEITEKYLELYKFVNTKYDSSCMTYESFKDFEPPVEMDLVIVVYDRELGEAELHTKKFGGAYLHDGADKQEKHIILLCDCATFYYSDPMWILSHELSHFVLYSLNFNTDIIETLVHANDKIYDACMKEYKTNCANVIYKLRVDSMAYSFSVMTPYKNAIGMKKIETPTQPVPTSVISLNKIVTKWWLEGKITESEYASAIGHMVDDQKKITRADDKVIYADGPINGNVTTWQDLLNEKTGNDDLFSIVPFAAKYTINKTSDEPTVLPDWFTNNANLWSKGKMPTEDFIRNVKYLKSQKIVSSQSDDVSKPIYTKSKNGNTVNVFIQLSED